jgi:hypothetical protein
VPLPPATTMVHTISVSARGTTLEGSTVVS